MDNRKAFLAQLEKLEPRLVRAFEAAFQDIRSTAQLRVIEDAIKRGDIQAALQAIQLGSEFFAPLDRMIVEAFDTGAIWQLSNLPKKTLPNGGSLLIRFNARNVRAERTARDLAASLITEISENQRLMVREVLEKGISEGRGARSLALDLVGRLEGNERKGGLLGLHSRQALAVLRARQELSDPSLMRGYFNRALRDRRLDGVVRSAIKEQRPVSLADIDRIARRYADRLLRHRGTVISRTEALAAFNAGRYEGVRQLVESGQVPASAVKLEWQSTPGPRTRDTHRSMNGQEVRFGQAFTSPSGAQLQFPGDTSRNAPPEEIINCRCSFRTKVDYTALAR